jgi:hypothetical protein
MLNYNNYSKCIIENAKTLLIEHIKYVLIRIRDLHYDRLIVKENEENKSFEILIDKNIYDVSKNDYTANKIMVNDNEKYHSRQKLENKVLLEYCKTFLNDLPSSKSFRKHRSFSQKKKSKNILLFSQQKNVMSSIDTENLPFLGDSSSKKMNKNCSSCRKKLPNI